MENIWFWCIGSFAIGMGVMFFGRKHWEKQPSLEQYRQMRYDNYKLKHNLDKAKGDMAFMLAHAKPIPNANKQGPQEEGVHTGKENEDKKGAGFTQSVSPYGEVLLLQKEWNTFKEEQKEAMADFQNRVMCDLRYLRESINSAQTPTLSSPAARNPRIKKHRPPFIHCGKK